MNTNDCKEFKRILSTFNDEELSDFIIYSCRTLYDRLMLISHTLIEGYRLSGEFDTRDISINVKVNNKQT